MRFAIVLLLALVFGERTLAQSWLANEFDARLLNYNEKRFLQAALALSGDYNALLDGEWGKGSQRSLEHYTIRNFGSPKPIFDDLVRLLRDAETEIIENGWKIMNFESTNTSYAHPFGILLPKSGQDVIEYNALDGTMSLVVEFADLNATLAIHQYFVSQSLPYPEKYQNYGRERIITSVSLKGGLVAYARSDSVDVGYMTLSIVANAQNKNRLSLIASSMQRGYAPPLDIPEDGILDMIAHPVAKLETLPDADVSADPPIAESTVPEAVGSGTAFYVNANILLTAEHVVSNCRSVTLADGTELAVVSRSAGLDLAALQSPNSSTNWLNVSSGSAASLGERVMAVGYPYYGTLLQGLTATSGNVSAMAGLDGGSDRMMFTAPIQPGNSGGPLLNSTGQVLGVVVSRVDDLTLLENTGTLPQNMNFAIPPGAVEGFLRDARVITREKLIPTFDLDSGIPEEVSAAVVVIICIQ